MPWIQLYFLFKLDHFSQFQVFNTIVLMLFNCKWTYDWSKSWYEIILLRLIKEHLNYDVNMYYLETTANARRRKGCVNTKNMALDLCYGRDNNIIKHDIVDMCILSYSDEAEHMKFINWILKQMNQNVKLSTNIPLFHVCW